MAPLYDKKTILVTGGAGCLGSYLCEALARKAQVICVDNFSTGTPANLQALLQQPNFELIRHDINEPLDLEAHRELERFHIRVHGIQEVYHLACPTSYVAANEYRLATMQTNSTGLRHILELTAKYRAKFLLASSSDVYEPSDEPYISEDARCWNDHLLPQAAYIESKRFAIDRGAGDFTTKFLLSYKLQPKKAGS
jgi:UDP-glucuronate decarboxylase